MTEPIDTLKIAAALLLLGAVIACGAADEDSRPKGALHSTQEDSPMAPPSMERATESPTATATAPLTEPNTAPTAQSQLITEPVKIAEGQVDLDRDGTKETTVYLLMTKGEIITDPEPGPYQGTHYSGQLEWKTAAADGTKVFKQIVNEAYGNEVMTLRDQPFELLFEDYNGDGNPDFTIGQRAGSNGSIYAIYSISSTELQLLQQEIYSADSRPSIQYRKVGDHSFLNRYYDMDKGLYMDVIYEWKDNAFVQSEPTTAIEPGSAGLD